MADKDTGRFVSQNDEFMLSRLLDDDLPADDAARLRERLEREPALREAFSSLARVDECLVRRQDDQPWVDYAQFHAQIMSAITAEASPTRTVRFPTWLRIGIPLAAAAAVIALLIWVQPGMVEKPGADSAVPRIQVAENIFEDGDPNVVDRASPGVDRASTSDETHQLSPLRRLIVQVNRPAPGRTALVIADGVAYSRSDELQEMIRQRDEDQRNQPAQCLFLASSSPDSPPDSLSSATFIEAFPL